MPSTQTVLETALLLLAAFLVGAIIGHLARRLAIARAAAAQRAPAEPVVIAEPPPPAIAPVVAPAIDPIVVSSPALPRKPTAAQRLAAAAGEREPIQRAQLPVAPIPAAIAPDAAEKSPPPAKARAKRATKGTSMQRRASAKAASDAPGSPPKRPRSGPRLKEPRD